MEINGDEVGKRLWWKDPPDTEGLSEYIWTKNNRGQDVLVERHPPIKPNNVTPFRTKGDL